MKKTQIIINRQKAAANRKFKGTLPEEPTISIHSGNEIDYAFAVALGGHWVLKQDYANSPCSGAHIWLESTANSTLEITHRKPLSEFPDDGSGDDSHDGDDATATPKSDKKKMEFW